MHYVQIKRRFITFLKERVSSPIRKRGEILMAQTDVTKQVKAVLTALNGLDIADAEHALVLAKGNLKPFATINYASNADLKVTDADLGGTEADFKGTDSTTSDETASSDSTATQTA